jgi:D-serine deaminase-like pyridoxal phosphate-dependent protein
VDWNQQYQQYKKCFKDQRYPLAFVDLDRFDRNLAYVAATQKGTGKTIRVASKSIRCVDLLRRVFDRGGAAYRGILSFTMEEAAFLLDQGFDDIVVAYPTVQPSDLVLFSDYTKKDARLSLMVDSKAHLEVLSQAGARAGVTLRVCIDADMSFRPLGSGLHLGVRRSPLRSPGQVLELLRHARTLSGIRISGIMGYEAQIASLNDNLPGLGIKNRLLRLFKAWSVRELTRRRKALVRAAASLGTDLEFVNGGGSGSLKSTGKDPAVTEVTAGSAFFAPGLFSHFHEVKFAPSAFFGLQVTRIPGPGMVTCLGGGYVGSGEVNKNRLPWPVMPEGLSYLPMEGAGEVQTPLVVPKTAPGLSPGDPVFFQHAKAGELCERFNTLYLVENNEIVGSAPTYRGQGYAFL